MDAYRPEAWHDLAVATVGACAALAGLIFVAVSLNLARILELEGLAGRAGRTLGLLVALLAAGIAVLVPGQSRLALGVELVVAGVLVGGSAIPPLHRGRVDPASPLHWLLLPAAIVLTPAAALVVAGIGVATGAGGGLFWLAGAMAVGIAGAVLNSWVLLVEIHR